MHLINLTPHPITIVGDDGQRYTLPSSGLARVESKTGIRTDTVHDCGDVPIYSAPEMGAVSGLPEPAAGHIYIVSQMVAARVPSRRDVVYPGTGPLDGAVRDSDGRVEAVTRLISAATQVEDTCIYCRANCGPASLQTGMGIFRIGYDCPVCGGN